MHVHAVMRELGSGVPPLLADWGSEGAAPVDVAADGLRQAQGRPAAAGLASRGCGRHEAAESGRVVLVIGGDDGGVSRGPAAWAAVPAEADRRVGAR